MPRWPAVVLLFGAFTLAGHAQRPVEQAPGTIRTGITVVPLDVRVLDRRGNPVTDLTRDDFVVLEDSVAQTISHFSTHALTPDKVLAAAGRLRPGEAPVGIEPANRRVFLLMLGRGRHQGVTKSIDALEAFVRDRLLPQDQVALLAWNRATDFTTDHELIRQTVRRYRERHERIETGMREWFSGLRAAYGSRDVPPFIQRDIDAVFADAKALRPREVRPGQITEERGINALLRQNAQELMSQQIASERPPGSELIPDYAAERKAELLGMDFEAYVTQSVETLQDVGALYAGIEYLRHLDGEKNLVLFTGAGLRLPRAEDSTALASIASDARITLNTIHTGGTAGAPPPVFMPGGGIRTSAVPTFAQVSNEGFAARELRNLAELTGGRAASFTYGHVALDRIDRGSRFQYLLAYAPKNPAIDGRFRRIEIKVRRPGVTVHYRHGYYAARRPVGMNRQRLRTASRIASAAEYGRSIDDLKISLQPPTIVKSGKGSQLTLQFRVDVSAIEFTTDGAIHTAQLDIAVFCADSGDKILREVWQPVEVALSDFARAQYQGEGAPVRVDLQVPEGVRNVKLVVYDPGSDLLGSAIARVR